jgi:four helix bundle protein
MFVPRSLVVLKSFMDLEVWKRAHGVVLEVYKLTNPFPRSEQFGVVSQIRRAAYSVPANIAEGFGRHSTKELLQFLAISNGSLEELHYFLILSRDLRYLSPLDLEKLEKDLKAIAQMLEALRQSLRRRLAGAPASSSRDSDRGSRVTKALSPIPLANGLSPSPSRDTGHGSRVTKPSSGVRN